MAYMCPAKWNKILCFMPLCSAFSRINFHQCTQDVSVIYDVLVILLFFVDPLHWRHNDHDGVSNHQPHGCLPNHLFRRRSKKTSKLRVTGHCVGNSPGPVNFPHKGPVTRKMFPFDDVIMQFNPLTIFLRVASLEPQGQYPVWYM